MPRVTEQEVKEILDTNVTLHPFIVAASLIVDKYLEDTGEIDDEQLLKEIERWLSAHLAVIRDPQLSKEKIGDASNEYARGSLGDGLKGTHYGQQVLLLDTSGRLSQLGKKKVKLEHLA